MNTSDSRKKPRAKSRRFFKQTHPSQSQKPKTPKSVKGNISISGRGDGYLEVEGFEDDIEIQNNNLKTALNRDEVEVKILPKKQNGRIQGEVIKIIRRNKTNFVGTVLRRAGKVFVEADDKRMYAPIELLNPDNNISDKEKVLVKIAEWKDSTSSPKGTLLRRIGTKGEHNAEIESIVLDKGFEIEFGENVESEARKLKQDSEQTEYWKNEALRRRDFRKTLTFTIDPKDAKDFDDAISIKDLGNKTYEIGVHIADVSHYVTEGSALNKEARKRGCSVYLVDRTIPMLPEILSNDLCSLNPNVDRLTFSAVFIIEHSDSKKIKIKDRWFGKTIIHSDKRFSYEDAQESINSKSGEYTTELQTLWSIAQVLREEKFRLGAIDFEADEVKFELDEKGVPIRVYKKERLDTHKLVEEFMLLANREVAEFFYKDQSKNKLPLSFLYRIHDKPDPEKLTNLSVFLRALGYELNIKDGITSKDISAILKKIEGKAEESLVKIAAIRAMSKAIYSTANIGHFGLAFQYYTHFTSPIRRYPDLLVHRVLFNRLSGKKIPQNEMALYQKMATEASENEVRASEAERASIKLKQVEYMKARIGETFEGTISGVTEWGIYVEEVNTRCEGMIKLRDMKGDYFNLDAKNYRLVGEKTGKIYALSDKVKFKVVGGDLERRTLDYTLM